MPRADIDPVATAEWHDRDENERNPDAVAQ